MSVPERKTTEDKFSLLLFALSVLGILATAAIGLRFLMPKFWERQWSAGWFAILLAFVVLHLNLCIFEWFFHRYTLHRIVVPMLRGLAKSHRHHHGLTIVTRLDPEKTGGPVEVRNKYPIVEERQYPSSFFPYYSLAAFLGVFTPWFVLLQVLLPRAPVMIGGYMAVSWSYVLYELVHAMEHLPYERWWRPKVEHPRWGRLWRKIYGFHLMHHACVRVNEAIGGFFGLPLIDWALGTYKQPRLIFLSGVLATAEDLAAPTPCRFIAWLDAIAERRENRLARRKALALARAN